MGRDGGQGSKSLQDNKALTRVQQCFKYFLRNPKERWENQNIRACGNLNPVVRKKEFMFHDLTFHVVLIGPDFRSFVF